MRVLWFRAFRAVKMYTGRRYMRVYVWHSNFQGLIFSIWMRV
jgi:hypothetical protein